MTELIILIVIIAAIHCIAGAKEKYDKIVTDAKKDLARKMQNFKDDFKSLMDRDRITVADINSFKSRIAAAGKHPDRSNELPWYVRSLEFKQQSIQWAEAVEKGEVQPLPQASVILDADERAYFDERCTLYKLERETVDNGDLFLGSSVTIGNLPLYFGKRVPLADNRERLKDMGSGNFVITDRRMIFSCPNVSFVIPMEDIFDIIFTRRALDILLQVMYDGRNSGYIYRVINPAKCFTIIVWILEAYKAGKSPGSYFRE